MDLSIFRMRRLFLALVLCWPIALRAEAPAPDVASDLVRTLSGETMIHLSFITSTSPEKIWRGLTNPDELKKWAAPQVNVELRPGGPYEFYFNPKREAGRRGIEGTVILAYVPNKTLVHSGVLPYTWVVWTIEPAGDQQAVHYYAVGTSSDWNVSASSRLPLAQDLVEKFAKYLQALNEGKITDVE